MDFGVRLKDVFFRSPRIGRKLFPRAMVGMVFFCEDRA
jgi:hypothetical protein